MLMVAKRSALALAAFLTLPPHSHDVAVAPTEPSAVLREAAALAAPTNLSGHEDVPQGATNSTARQTVPASPRPVDRAPAAPAAPVKLPLEIGDKLKIGFYETIDVGDAGQRSRDGADSQDSLRTFYQRMDLSGEYSVEQDGSFSVPLLGQFRAEGRALDDLRSDLAAAFASVIGHNANVDVTILERSPVYVVGPVKNPGAYKYAPGMIALHAVALAGGLDRGVDNISGMAEGSRELERLRISTLKLEQLRARRTRLEAELAGVSGPSTSGGARQISMPMPDEAGSKTLIAAQPAEPAQGRSAGSILATEGAILSAEQARRRQQDKEFTLKVEAAQNEIDALKHKLVQFDVQKDLRIERLDAMEKLKDRGVETSNNVLMLRTEMSDIEARRQDSLVAVAESETRLAELEGARQKASLEYTEDLVKEIATVDKDLGEAREAILSARALTSILNGPNIPGASGPTYGIIRQSKDGPKTYSATETSPLMPGDILKVIPGEAFPVDSGASAAGPQSVP